MKQMLISTNKNNGHTPAASSKSAHLFCLEFGWKIRKTMKMWLHYYYNIVSCFFICCIEKQR